VVGLGARFCMVLRAFARLLRHMCACCAPLCCAPSLIYLPPIARGVGFRARPACLHRARRFTNHKPAPIISFGGHTMRRYKSVESKLLRAIGARRFPASGANLPVEDGSDGRYHIQLKVTSRPFYLLRADDLHRLSLRAITNMQVPLFAIYFSQPDVFVFVHPCDCAHDVAAGDCKTVRRSARIYPHSDFHFALFGSPFVWKVTTTPAARAKLTIDSIYETCLRAVRGGNVQ